MQFKILGKLVSLWNWYKNHAKYQPQLSTNRIEQTVSVGMLASNISRYTSKPHKVWTWRLYSEWFKKSKLFCRLKAKILVTRICCNWILDYLWAECSRWSEKKIPSVLQRSSEKVKFPFILVSFSGI